MRFWKNVNRSSENINREVKYFSITHAKAQKRKEARK